MFTAPDYFPLLTRLFHRQTGWDENNLYSTFCRASQSILDFNVPYGVSVNTNKGISSNLHSQMAFSMIPSRASSIGYLATSKTLLIPRVKTSSTFKDQDNSHPKRDKTADLASTQTLDPDFIESNAEGLLTGFQPSFKDNEYAEATNSGIHRTDHRYFSDARKDILDEYDPTDLLQSIRSGAWKCNWNFHNTTAQNKPGYSIPRDYLLVAQMYPSVSSITGMYILRRSKTTELIISGISTAGPLPSIEAVIRQTVNNRKWSSEATFSMNGGLLGLRGLYNFGNTSELDRAAYNYYYGNDSDAYDIIHSRSHGRFSIGGELYYGIQDSSGGVSVGARYRHDLPLFSNITCVFNPIMGHISLAWAQTLRPKLHTAARYDFNIFSLSSNLAIGAEWHMDQGSILKASWSESHGLKCCVDASLGNMIFTMGLVFKTDENTSMKSNTNSAIEMKQLVKSLGFQLQWFL